LGVWGEGSQRAEGAHEFKSDREHRRTEDIRGVSGRCKRELGRVGVVCCVCRGLWGFRVSDFRRLRVYRCW